MRMRNRRPLSCLVGAAALALTAPVLAALRLPAQAVDHEGGRADVVVRVKDLPTRHRALDVAWLNGSVAHKPGGGTLKLPWAPKAARDRHLRLVGKTAQGWLVKDSDGGAWRVWLARRGERTLISQHGVSEGDIVSIRLSDDRRRYAVSYYSGEEEDNVVSIRDLDGQEIASRLFPNDAAVLDFSGPEAVIGTTATMRWSLGTDTAVAIGADLEAADLAHDLAFVRTGDAVGPTSLSDPGDPGWTAPLAEIAASPTGDLVLSRPSTTKRKLTVRDVTTGDVVRSYRVDYLVTYHFTWETDHSFILLGSPGSLGDRQVLVRCTVGGRCAAQSPRTARDSISYAP